VFAGHGDFETVFAGVSTAGDEQVGTLPLEGSAGHEYQSLHARQQSLQGVHSLWALQRKQAAIIQVLDFAEGADGALNVGKVAHFAGAVDDDKNVFAPVDEHEVVDDAAGFIEQQTIPLFAHRKVDDIHRHQGFEGRRSV